MVMNTGRAILGISDEREDEILGILLKGFGGSQTLQ